MQCFKCNKKLKLTEQFECKCSNLYCKQHRLNHNCKFDYREHCSKILTKEMPKVVGSKFEKI